jgi:hypothetical protein
LPNTVNIDDCERREQGAGQDQGHASDPQDCRQWGASLMARPKAAQPAAKATEFERAAQSAGLPVALG